MMLINTTILNYH